VLILREVLLKIGVINLGMVVWVANKMATIVIPSVGSEE
jgi:hypothetical protein